MSERSRDLPRRSCLSVPGSSVRFLEKAPNVPADMTVLDLEDSVAVPEKETARARVIEAIRKVDWDDRVLCVRLNGWRSRWTYGDAIEVVGASGERLDEVMLPKVESAAEVEALDLIITQVELNSGLPAGHIGIEVQIETARGLINVEEICAASPRLEAVVFGPADFAASVEMPVLTGGVQIDQYPGDHFHYVFSKILMAGRANGIQVIDGPYLKIREPEMFRDYCHRAHSLGYDGKWALHPDQVTILNEVFSPTQEQFDRAWAILDAYEQATGHEAKGAVMFGDEMIDEASHKMALKFVSRGERAGLQRSGPAGPERGPATGPSAEGLSKVPELPQMQALAERVDAAVGGAGVAKVEILGFSGLKTVMPAGEGLEGDKLEGVGRRGKYLVFGFESGRRVLVHLSQAGRLDIEAPPKQTRPRGSVVRFVFDNGTALLVREHGHERKAGWWVLAAGDDGPLESLGPEPFDEAFDELLISSEDSRHLHTLLRDQHFVAGVGRGYADDALNRARLSPFSPLKSLGESDRRQLVDTVRAVLAEAIVSERGREGGLSEPKLGTVFAVHNRAGQPCPACGESLHRVSYESHEVVYCTHCQTKGRVLADRRLSRLLK